MGDAKLSDSEIERVLPKKLEVHIRRLADAGIVELQAYHFGCVEFATHIINSGSPFSSAYAEAEHLAVVLDAQLYLNRELVRDTLTNQFGKPKDKQEG